MNKKKRTIFQAVLIVVKNKVRRGFNQKYRENNATVSISMSVYRLKWTSSLKSIPKLNGTFTFIFGLTTLESAVTQQEYAVLRFEGRMRSWESNRTDSFSSRANEMMGNKKGIEVGKEALSKKERQ